MHMHKEDTNVIFIKNMFNRLSKIIYKDWISTCPVNRLVSKGSALKLICVGNILTGDKNQ